MYTVACPPPAVVLSAKGAISANLHVGAKEGEAAESEARKGEGGVVTRHGLQSCNPGLCVGAICAWSVSAGPEFVRTHRRVLSPARGARCARANGEGSRSIPWRRRRDRHSSDHLGNNARGVIICILQSLV